MSRDVDGDQVRGEVSPGGTEGAPRRTEVPPWAGRHGAIGPGPTWDGAQETRSGAAHPPRRAYGASLP
jgi:hypothetical protein